jgi:hypothetical protein
MVTVTEMVMMKESNSVIFPHSLQGKLGLEQIDGTLKYPKLRTAILTSWTVPSQ